MQFNDDEGDTSYLQRGGNGRGRQQHLKSAATPPPAKPQVGGAVAAGAAGKAGSSSGASLGQPASQRDDQRVTGNWAAINNPEAHWADED